MTWYTLDERSVVGHDGIDAAHRQIADLSHDLDRAVAAGASFGEIYRIYRNLAQALRAHFEQEEQLLAKLRHIPEVAAHIEKHHENHSFFRDALKYADAKFQDRIASGRAPHVAGLIAKEYFEELKDLDCEMAALFKKHNPS